MSFLPQPPHAGVRASKPDLKQEELWRTALEQAESSTGLYNKLNNFWFKKKRKKKPYKQKLASVVIKGHG